MNSVLSISAAGMQGAMQRVQLAAHNVASLSSSTAQTDPAVGRDASQGPQQGAGVLGELMAVRIANNVIASNAAMIRRWDEMLGNLLDVHA